jgi:hypothetical protein
MQSFVLLKNLSSRTANENVRAAVLNLSPAAAMGSRMHNSSNSPAEYSNLSYSYPAFLHELLDIQINLNIQQDLKIVHSYYPAGYLYPAVHRTAAHWTAGSIACNAGYELLCQIYHIYIQHCHYYPAGYLYPAVHGTAAQRTAEAMLLLLPCRIFL